MSGLAWKLNRLRAMSPAEVAFRGARWFALRRERRAVGAGRVPQPAQPVGPRRSLFDADGWQDAWHSRFALDTDALAELLQGRIEVFGAALEVGETVAWHRDPASGREAPRAFGKAIDYRDPAQVGNVKVLWELGRHQHLLPVAVAYAVTGQAAYRDYVVRQIESWIAQNPYGTGIHWCSALEVSLRLLAWSFVHSLFALRDGEEGLFAAVADRAAFGAVAYRHAVFVRGYLSRHSSGNNHLIGELTGLLVGCSVFDFGASGAQWRAWARRELEREALRQVHPDGVGKEQALYYHLWVLEYLLLAWLVLQRESPPQPAGYTALLEKMVGFIEAVTPPGGRPPQIGDADDGFVTRFSTRWPKDPYAEMLSTAHQCLRLTHCSGRELPSTEKAFWYARIGVATGVGTSPASATRVTEAPYPRIYKSGGYCVLGAAGLHCVFDTGPMGYLSLAAHGHSDALGLVLAVDGDWWLVDSGTYAYHGEPGWREYFRGAQAHNVLCVDGRDPSQSGGAFLWTRQTDARLFGHGHDDRTQWAAGLHTGYPGLEVRRDVVLAARERCLRITDRVDGAGTRRLDLHFHFHPDVALRREGGDGWVAERAGARTRCRLRTDPAWAWSTHRGETQPPLGWYSERLHVKQPATVLKGTRLCALPGTVTTEIRVVSA